MKMEAFRLPIYIYETLGVDDVTILAFDQSTSQPNRRDGGVSRPLSSVFQPSLSCNH